MVAVTMASVAAMPAARLFLFLCLLGGLGAH